MLAGYVPMTVLSSRVGAQLYAPLSFNPSALVRTTPPPIGGDETCSEFLSVSLGALALSLPAAAQLKPFPDDFRTQEIKTDDGTTMHIRAGSRAAGGRVRDELFADREFR